MLSMSIFSAPALVEARDKGEFDWVNYGKHGQNSEISLALDSMSYDQESDAYFFTYKITTNGEPVFYAGESSICANGNPRGWRGNAVGSKGSLRWIPANSPASRTMIESICKIVKPAPIAAKRKSIREICASNRKTAAELRGHSANIPASAATSLNEFIVSLELDPRCN